jgi:hypothetical protein
MPWKWRVMVPTWGVVEGLLLRGGACGDVVAFPEPGEVGAFDQEFADEGGIGIDSTYLGSRYLDSM